MTQPTPYDRSYSFTDFSSGSPTSQPPGDKIDAELDAVAETLDDVLASLALIQRDDGALASGSVGIDQLSATTLALVVGDAFAVRGPWVTAHAYIAGDVVSSGSLIYLCLTAHTSGVLATDTAAGKFVLIFDATNTALQNALALTTGAGMVGSAGGITVQAALNLKASLAQLAAATGAALIGTAGGITVEAALALKLSVATLAAAGGSANVGFALAATGAVTRTAESKMRDTVSIKDFGALGDGIANDTAAFNLALTYVQSLPRGGEIYLPAGIYLMDMDCSRTAADDTDRVRIRGAGRGATQIKPTAGGVIILNMVGRNAMTVSDLTIYAGDTYQAYAGIVLARSVASNGCNDNHFFNVEVVGNYSKACVVSIAAESGSWINCKFWPTVDVTCMIIGSNPAAAGVGLVVSGHVLTANADTDIRMVGCNFYSTVTTGAMLTLSAAHSLRAFGCSFIATVAAYHVKLVDPNTGIMGLNSAFYACHWEGLSATGAVFYAQTGGTSYLYGLAEEGGTFQTSVGGKYLDYDRTGIANLLILDGCRFRPGKLLDTTQTEFNLYCDIATNTIIDWSNVRDQGAVCIFTIASAFSHLTGNIRCWQQSGSFVAKPPATSLPTAGVFHAGALVANGASPAAGGAAGWVAVHGGSVDTDPGGRTVTNVNGSPQATLGGAYAEVYEGGRYSVTGFGNVVVRKLSGTTVYFAANMVASSSVAIKSSGAAAAPTFRTLGIAGATLAGAVADTSGATLAALETSVNALKATLRTATLMAP